MSPTAPRAWKNAPLIEPLTLALSWRAQDRSLPDLEMRGESWAGWIALAPESWEGWRERLGSHPWREGWSLEEPTEKPFFAKKAAGRAAPMLGTESSIWNDDSAPRWMIESIELVWRGDIPRVWSADWASARRRELAQMAETLEAIIKDAGFKRVERLGMDLEISGAGYWVNMAQANLSGWLARKERDQLEREMSVRPPGEAGAATMRL